MKPPEVAAAISTVEEPAVMICVGFEGARLVPTCSAMGVVPESKPETVISMKGEFGSIGGMSPAVAEGSTDDSRCGIFGVSAGRCVVATLLCSCGAFTVAAVETAGTPANPVSDCSTCAVSGLFGLPCDVKMMIGRPSVVVVSVALFETSATGGRRAVVNVDDMIK